MWSVRKTGPMVRHEREVGEKRYREDYGRYYEEFEVGDVYQHPLGRTISETVSYSPKDDRKVLDDDLEF